MQSENDNESKINAITENKIQSKKKFQSISATNLIKLKIELKITYFPLESTY